MTVTGGHRSRSCMLPKQRAAIKAPPTPPIRSRPYGILGWLLRLMSIRQPLRSPAALAWFLKIVDQGIAFAKDSSSQCNVYKLFDAGISECRGPGHEFFSRGMHDLQGMALICGCVYTSCGKGNYGEQRALLMPELEITTNSALCSRQVLRIELFSQCIQ